MTFPIVIPAFRRTDSLGRLLRSLLRADIPSGVRLIIAIDRPEDQRLASDNRAVVELARAFKWPYGPLDLIWHDQPLGLIGNTYFCHALATDYGAAIVLEDDLVVARPFYTYAMQALVAYGRDSRIGGIALNTLWYNGFTHQPFIPLSDAADVFFLQLATPQGQLYTAEQWQAYASWLAWSDHHTADTFVHPLVSHMPPTDWLPDTMRYLASTGRTFVFPRDSLTVSFGDAGTHIRQDSAFFQVPLQDIRRTFRLGSLDDSSAVYDSFYEIRPDVLSRLAPALADIEFAVDLYATKQPQHLKAEWVLTSRPARSARATFAKVMRPMEANVIHEIAGEGLSLARVTDVDFSSAATLATHRDNDAYFSRYRSRGRRPAWMRRLRFGRG